MNSKGVSLGTAKFTSQLHGKCFIKMWNVIKSGKGVILLTRSKLLMMPK